ncbi:MAG: alpha-1,2-fucosyltransferase [Lachnospiraceae bacterium]|nr:alpha-1,2-fucosyltransferase [Lachnospiraceae bacterium]
MNIIRMSGGLGNQMFQYALYLRLVSLGREVKFDDVTEYKLSNARPIMLSVFGINYPRATEKEIREITDSSLHPVHRIRRKLWGRRSREYREASVNFDSAVLEKEEAYLCGCFQSERYFQPIEAQVREVFHFQKVKIPEEIQSRFREYQQRILASCSVAIHIRRGDYLQVQEVYGGICTEAYYEGAIRLLLDNCPEAEFFIFTNDTSWAEEWGRQKETQFNRPFTVIQGTSEETGYLDLMLMGKCRHYIIANSSFSWWGAWLNGQPDKQVVAPSRWLNTCECRDIYTSGMLRVDGGGRLWKKN